MTCWGYMPHLPTLFGRLNQMTCWGYMPHLPALFGRLNQMTCWRYMPHLLLILKDPMKFSPNRVTSRGQELWDRWCPDEQMDKPATI